ncbi:MAG: peptidoglycan-binding protein [Oscillospiraceae bacterium]
MCNNVTNTVANPPFPGTVLRVGSSGSEVARMQTYLNVIRTMQYPGLNHLTVDGKYGNATKTTVMQFQGYARLAIDGSIGKNTWDAIVIDYNTFMGGSENTYPGIPLREGMTGSDVTHMQRLLNAVTPPYTAINSQTVDGAFGGNMYNAAKRFQRLFSLSIDGIIGEITWSKIVAVYTAVSTASRVKVTAAYAGTPLSVGSSGDAVRCVQMFLNGTNGGKWGPLLTVDGQYGNKTRNSTIAFQAHYGLTTDGVVGSATWAKMVSEFNKTL